MMLWPETYQRLVDRVDLGPLVRVVLAAELARQRAGRLDGVHAALELGLGVGQRLADLQTEKVSLTVSRGLSSGR